MAFLPFMLREHMAGAVWTLLSGLRLSIFVFGLLCWPCLFISSVLSFLPCCVFLWVADFKHFIVPMYTSVLFTCHYQVYAAFIESLDLRHNLIINPTHFSWGGFIIVDYFKVFYKSTPSQFKSPYKWALFRGFKSLSDLTTQTKY